jgi:anti-sigma-K factor RskA
MTPMSHDDAHALLAAAALDALTGAERESARAHVTGCEACRAEMGTLQETVGTLVHAVAPYSLPADRSRAVRARLVARAEADRRSRGDSGAIDLEQRRGRASAASVSRERTRARRTPLIFEWRSAAVLVFAVAVGVYALTERGRARALAATLSAAQQAEGRLRAELATLGDSLADREELLAGLTGPSVEMVQLVSARARAPSARMFWDQARDRWTFIAHDLPAARAGRTYQLWLITPSDQKISAGTFTPRSDGRALVRATYALPRDSLAAVAVTEEPSGGVEQPTGEIVVAGRTER